MTICLVAGLVGGGLFADFSDIETSRDNYFQTGALDLKVSNQLGVEFQDPNVPAFYQITDAWPCCDKSIFFDLENYGQGFQKVPELYVHFKNFECYWVVPKNVWAWVDANGNTVDPPDPEPVHGDIGMGFPKPLNEPEYVAELGGIAGEDVNGDPVVVPGIGLCYGEDCRLAEHIGVMMWVAGPYNHPKPALLDVPQGDWRMIDIPDTDGDGHIKLNDIFCWQVDLGPLPSNSGLWVHISLHFQDYDEEEAVADGLLDRGYFDENIPCEAKWDHWPTNAMQKDGMRFDMAFELLQIT